MAGPQWSFTSAGEHKKSAVFPDWCRAPNGNPRTIVPSPAEPRGSIQLYSPTYFYTCGAAGALACGPTHWAVTPLDVVKCNMQIDPAKYKGIGQSFRTVYAEEGLRGFMKGNAPTFIGYALQGMGKYGFYEYFKYVYSDWAGPELAAKYKTGIYIAGSASAEFLADIMLCPFEAVKVRVQTQPGFGFGLADGFPKYVQQEGYAGLYRGILPLWGRQIPYTITKFATFETTVEALYKYAVPVPKAECSKGTQLGVSFAAGYIAGVLCAAISQPADNLVSFMNNVKGATAGQAIKSLGLLGLMTRGLPLRIVQIGTLTGTQWAIYDSVKVAAGLPTTGGVSAHPAPPKVEGQPPASAAT